MTEENNVPVVVEFEPVVAETEIRGKIIVPIGGQDYHKDYIDLGLSFESTEEEILEMVRPILNEEFDSDIKDSNTGWLFKVHKALDNRNIYIIPNSTAGI